jgi:hypothetical protein
LLTAYIIPFLRSFSEDTKAIINHSRDRADVRIDEQEISEISLLVWADKIAYTFSDINDLKRVGMLFEKDMPEGILKLGTGKNAKKKENNHVLSLWSKKAWKKAEFLLQKVMKRKFLRKPEIGCIKTFIRSWIIKKSV